MNDRSILNIGVVTDMNAVYIAPQDRAIPYINVLTQRYFTNKFGAGGNETGTRHCRLFSTEFDKHLTSNSRSIRGPGKVTRSFGAGTSMQKKKICDIIPRPVNFSQNFVDSLFDYGIRNLPEKK